MGDRTISILIADIIDDLASAIDAEIDIDIGRGNAFGIEEPFEEEFVIDGIDIGDPHSVGDHGAGGGTAAWTDGNALGLCPGDEVPNDQEIIDEALGFEESEFAVDAFEDDGVIGGAGAVAGVEAFLNNLPEVAVLGEAFGRGEVRIFWNAKLDLEIASFGDLEGISECLGMVLKESGHLGGRFEIHFWAVFFALFVGGMDTGADTNQDVVGFVMGTFEEVDVVGGDEFYAEISADAG